MEANSRNENVFVRHEQRVTYVQENALFGLIRWYKKISTESLYDDVFVIINTPVRKVVVLYNGEEKIFTL